jgi:cyclophilin family peptidyl-prolyl cis-trans isomerase
MAFGLGRRVEHTARLALLLLAGCRAHLGNDNIFLHPESKEFTRRAPAVSHLIFETTKGPFTLELVRANGPLGADRFYNLARLGYYDDTRFHRVVPNYVVQFGINGDPRVNAAWKDHALADDPPRSMNRRGTFAFAFPARPNTRNTQIFINLADNTRSDTEAFTTLGTVIDGMPVLEKLYSGYGENSGGGMRQGKQPPLIEGGNAYMDKEYPFLDRILRVRVNTIQP